jgi:transcription initiation factor IIE alpha subunit
MEDIFYDILEELYFIQTFDGIVEKLNLESNVLQRYLWKMYDLGLIKTMVNFDEEIEQNEEEFERNFKKYHYIAAKKGLMWHNSL